MTPSNVVLIVLDTARNQAIDPRTAPNISDIASEGTEFTNAFATAPWTLPSHAGLFTGTYSSKHGAHAGHKKLDDKLATLPEVFNSMGYETTAVSNNTWISEEFGFGRGFETFHQTWQYVQSDTDLGKVVQTKEGTKMVPGLLSELFSGNPLINVANAVYGKFFRRYNDDGAAKTNQWISDWLESRDDDRPFFLFVNYLEPHLEYRPPKQYVEQFLPDDIDFKAAMEVSQDAWRYNTGDLDLSDRDFNVLQALYQAEISYLDQKIGQLRDELIDANKWDNTLFVLTSDHGENIGEHGLMDHQYCLYNTLLHVPLVVQGGPFNGGKIRDELVQLTDIAPTLLDATNIDAKELSRQCQGKSFYPGKNAEERNYVIAEYMAPQPSIDALKKRVGTLPEEVTKYDRSLRTILTAKHKLIRGSDGSCECYNIREDSDEKTDLSNFDPKWVTELSAQLDTWLDSFDHAKSQGEVTMQAETKERLEDLGYIQ